MFGPYEALIGYQTTLVTQCVKSIASAIAFYTGVLDPRPDLALPARLVKRPYAWWW